MNTTNTWVSVIMACKRDLKLLELRLSRERCLVRREQLETAIVWKQLAIEAASSRSRADFLWFENESDLAWCPCDE